MFIQIIKKFENEKISVINQNVTIVKINDFDFISLTDIAKYKSPDAPADVVKNWLRSKNTIELLGLWEKLNNLNFKLVEFDQFKNEAGYNHFVLSPKKWIVQTNAIGLRSKAGKNGGTYAHKDIAFEFASWVSVEFKLYLIKEFQRLKEDENNRLKLEWNFQRTLAKVNYHIHTDAIKENLIPEKLSKKQISYVYANEADVLNLALFGKTAKQWREENPNEKGNIRDYATIEQLVVLSNMESINAMLIQQNIPQPERLQQLNQLAITQMKSLLKHTDRIKKLK